MNNAQLINQTSGNTEYYTPSFVIDAARKTMGDIDLDPASSEKANSTIKAYKYYTKENDGLNHFWFGTVWMNHPFGRKENRLWVNKLIREYEQKRVHSACCITFASTSEAWFTPLFRYPMCFLSPRTNYLLPDGTTKKGVTKGSVVVYLGDSISKFIDSFILLGNIMLPGGK